MINSESKYRQLYRDYARAIRAYENATKDRRQIRAALKKQRLAGPRDRRPVGSPRDFVIPQQQGTSGGQSPQTKETRIYMGPILGWAIILPTKDLIPETDPTADFDPNHMYDLASIHLFWNARDHYQKCKRAFFHHVRNTDFLNDVRKKNIETHYKRAKAHVTHGQNLQLLGVDSDEEALVEAQREVEFACRNALALFKESPSPKSTEVIKILLHNMVEAQFTGLESETTTKIETEFDDLYNAGRLKIEKKQSK